MNHSAPHRSLHRPRLAGQCWDNAQQESFWSTLKAEFYQRRRFPTRADAIHAVNSWIDTVYNHRRRHNALG